jgi:hypothetical protein
MLIQSTLQASLARPRRRESEAKRAVTRSLDYFPFQDSRGNFALILTRGGDARRV